MILDVGTIDTYYGETQALFGVSLQVDAGEVVALLGPNGAGKTTTLRSIIGLTRPRRGTIRFDGTDVSRKATHDIARMGIGWVPDDRRICPTLTVARALLGSPGLVLFDEPSQGLAPKIVQDVLATIRRLKDEGLSVIIVEQNAETALSVADRVYVLDRGAVAWTGTAATLRHDPAKRRELLGA